MFFLRRQTLAAGEAIGYSLGMLGARIRYFRKTAKLSPKQLADLLNVTDVAVRYWENDQRTPSYKRILQIAQALDVPAHVFLAGPHEEAE